MATCGCRCACCDPPCGCESARVLPSLLGPSPSGSVTFLAFVPQLEALSESLTQSIPRSFLVVALSASAVGCADALWLCSERALSRFFASVLLVDPVALSPLLHRVFADGFRHWCAFRLCGGASPHAFGSVGALGELQWLHLYRLTLDLVGLRQFAVWLWSSGRCFIFPVRQENRVLFLGHLTRRVTGLTFCPSPRSSGILSFALTYSHDSLILMHPAIDIVWRCPCLPRLRLL